MLEVKATSKYVRTSAQKAGLVLELIRGKKAADALSILHFTKKSVARDIEKTLRSAIANAVNVADKNQKRRLDEDDLVVSACLRRPGPVAEARAAGAHGPRLPDHQAHHAPHGGGGRGRGARGGAEGGQGGEARGQDREDGKRRRRPPRRRDATAPRRRPSRRGRRAPRRSRSNGSEGPSDRVPARLQQDLAQPLVRREGIREPAPRGHQAQEGPQEALRPRRASPAWRSSARPTS